jgi:hypothetical protein
VRNSAICCPRLHFVAGSCASGCGAQSAQRGYKGLPWRRERGRRAATWSVTSRGADGITDRKFKRLPTATLRALAGSLSVRSGRAACEPASSRRFPSLVSCEALVSTRFLCRWKWILPAPAGRPWRRSLKSRYRYMDEYLLSLTHGFGLLIPAPSQYPAFCSKTHFFRLTAGSVSAFPQCRQFRGSAVVYSFYRVRVFRYPLFTNPRRYFDNSTIPSLD